MAATVTDPLPGQGAISNRDSAGNLPANGDVVPPEHLEPPDEGEYADLDRDACAELLDGYLRKLARRESLCRKALGGLAARFLDERGYNSLGFASLGDYSRERLGVSSREVQSLAQVARRLEQLPLCSAAFEEGRINWTKLRELARAATKETERAWLTLAASHPASELARLAKEYADHEPHRTHNEQQSREAAAREPSASADIFGLRDHHDETDSEAGVQEDEAHITTQPRELNRRQLDPDSEPRAALRLRCPGWLAVAWRSTLELSSRVVGSDVADWQAAEAIAAEAISAAPVGSAEPVPGRSPAHAIDPARAARRRDGLEVRQHRAANELDESMLLVRRFVAHDGSESLDEARPPRELIHEYSYGGSTFEDSDLEALRAALDQDAVVDAIDVVETAEPGADRHLTAAEIDSRMRAAIATMQRTDWQTGRLLRTIVDLRLFYHLGYATSAAYMTDRLGISVRKARSLMRIERASLASGLELTAAYRTGRVSWLRALLLARVVTEATAVAWIERAEGVTIRRLRAEVEWAQEQRELDPRNGNIWPPDPSIDLSSVTAGTTVLDAAAVLEHVHIGARQAPAESPPGEDAASRGTPLSAIPRDSCIRFTGPESVIELFVAAIDAHVRAHEPAWVGLYRMLRHVHAEWLALPTHPNPIFARDGWRCRVPACSSRRNLQEHHVVFRSRGGTNERQNRISICAWHHLRAIHVGTVKARGNANDEIEWEIGTGRDRRPLMRLVNDAYL